MMPIDAHGALRVLIPLAIAATIALSVAGVIAGRRLALQFHPDLIEPRAPLSRTRAALRTVAGLALVAAGVALLVLPGPGLMFIAFGALMLAPSWRARIVRAAVRRPRVLRWLNAFRRRHGFEDLSAPPSVRDG